MERENQRTDGRRPLALLGGTGGIGPAQSEPKQIMLIRGTAALLGGRSLWKGEASHGLSRGQIAPQEGQGVSEQNPLRLLQGESAGEEQVEKAGGLGGSV